MHLRQTRDVLTDHLRRRAAGDLDGDLATNYHSDVVILHPDGESRGHDGVRALAARHGRYDGAVECHRLLASDQVGIFEWSGLGGRSGTMPMEGTESFVVRDGLIVAQTVHFSSAVEVGNPLADVA
jgi:SnoaL-like domain